MARIAILEDDLPRRAAMATHLSADVVAFWFASATPMIAWLAEHVDSCALISLDHDLIAPRGEPDPGSGMDVAEFLATRTPRAPVLVHTSNSLAAPGMTWTLEQAGWVVDRVVPFSDLEWVDRSWAPRVLAVLAASAGR